eukprot:12529543-Alexandrium_andersonii.AAC.1
MSQRPPRSAAQRCSRPERLAAMRFLAIRFPDARGTRSALLGIDETAPPSRRCSLAGPVARLPRHRRARGT